MKCPDCGELMFSYPHNNSEYRCKKCNKTFNLQQMILEELIKIRVLLSKE